MTTKEIKALVDRAVGKDGILRVPSYWMNRIINKTLDAVDDVAANAMDKEYIAQKDAETLEAAKVYTNEAEERSWNTAKDYVDSKAVVVDNDFNPKSKNAISNEAVTFAIDDIYSELNKREKIPETRIVNSGELIEDINGEEGMTPRYLEYNGEYVYYKFLQKGPLVHSDNHFQMPSDCTYYPENISDLTMVIKSDMLNASFYSPSAFGTNRCYLSLLFLRHYFPTNIALNVTVDYGDHFGRLVYAKVVDDGDPFSIAAVDFDVVADNQIMHYSYVNGSGEFDYDIFKLLSTDTIATTDYIDSKFSQLDLNIFVIPSDGVLPETGKEGKIYLIPSDGGEGNIYDEYLYNGAWEKIGAINFVVDQELNAESTNAISNKAVAEAIIENELTLAAAVLDLKNQFEDSIASTLNTEV